MTDTAPPVVRSLLDFIAASPTAFQCVETVAERLRNVGYTELQETAPWQLTPGSGYFVTRDGSSLIAFLLGSENPSEAGFRIIGAHTDSPALKLKFEGESVSGGCVRVTTEVYGGPIMSTWLDRPLSIAGRIFIDRDGEACCRLLDLRGPVAIVPNLAIHYNREMNKGFEYNQQQHLAAVISGCPDTGNGSVLRTLLARELNVLPAEILSGDLFLYDPSPGVVFGGEGDFINAPRIDNLAMCHAILEALTSGSGTDATAVAVFSDNEEIGSRTPQGADSNFARDVMRRVTTLTGKARDDTYRALAASTMISADTAHAVHPNFADKHDPQYAPVINGGPCIKASATYRYATTAKTAAHFELLCRRNEIPVQKLVNRSDIASGSTIGPMSAAHLGVQGLDVGNPIWAMHSIRETAGVKDHGLMIAALKAYYGE